VKFTIRRAIVGVISIPLLAGAYVFFYLLLLLAGAEPTVTLTESFNNGLLIGITSAVFFTFAPRILHLIDRITFS
jgi:hypothetical protein